MALLKVFDVAGSGMSAQTTRLNTVASNLANVNSLAGDPQQVYRARMPVFQSVLDRLTGNEAQVGVRIADIVAKEEQPEALYDPSNPLADAEGYVFRSTVDPMEEMANMMSASQSFQSNVEVLNTVKQLLLATLRIGE
ncbi:MAG: flagellar basal body rod protein FlgC [Pseudomonadales bacterium]|nr:flagellar basal body rod protein FlgC [Pseudomonadales bacterium]